MPGASKNEGSPKRLSKGCTGASRMLRIGRLVTKETRMRPSQDEWSVLVHEVHEAVQGARQEREDHLRPVERGNRDQVKTKSSALVEATITTSMSK
jgi:hypothetical protein